MSLQIWLPLNGNLNNQGLSNICASGTMSYTSGKIGQSVQLSSSNVLTIPYNSGASNTFSFSFWIKIPTEMSNNTSWETMMSFKAIGTLNSNSIATIQINYANYHQVKIYDNGNHEHNWRTPNYDTWEHWSLTHEPYGSGGVTTKFYINGILQGSYNSDHPLILQDGNIIIGNGVLVGKFYLNDFRVYDHCLSVKEVKEISKGLICHYPLKSIAEVQKLNNVYRYPTFDTSSSNGGWNHCGQSGSSGSYSQNTSKNYIFNSSQTYSHNVSNSASATGDYLLYQEKLFSGGYRCMQAIIKESNGLPITDSICYPTWNGNTTLGVANNHWTSIISLGDGFYLCKVEGINQTTSPSSANSHLVGIYVKPGYSIYVSACYVENTKYCSYIGTDNEEVTIYDCSGYENNGTKVGTIAWSGDSARYSGSYNFDSKSHYKIPCPLVSPQEFSCSFWIKPISCGGYAIISSNYNNPSSGFWLAVNCEGSGLWFYNGSYAKSNKGLLFLNTWYHVCFVFNKGIITWYQNGEVAGTTDLSSKTTTLGIKDYISIGNSFTGTAWNTNYSGNISDFRIYSTALSADDVKSLYNVSASINKTGVLTAYEVIEN